MDEEGNPIGSVDGLTKTNSKVQIGNQNVVIVEQSFKPTAINSDQNLRGGSSMEQMLNQQKQE